MGFAADGSFFYSIYTLHYAKSVAPFDERTGSVLLEAAEPILGNHDILSFGWSPNGENLALIYHEEDVGLQEDQHAIRVKDMNSGTERVLTRDIIPFNLSGPRWMPDGRSILIFGTDREVARGDRPETPPGLLRIDVETGEITRLFEVSPDEGGKFGINWVPTADGRGVIYLYGGRLVRRDLESEREEELFQHPDLQSGLHLSPDGSELLFKVPDSTVPRGKRLMIMPSVGGEPRELLTIGGAGSAVNFNWSLDGQHIFFFQREEGGTAIMRVPREGGDPERLWETDERILGFPLSPDHRKVGIIIQTNEAEIWVMENLVAVLKEGGSGS
jgi:Tol biopolymer transport system component